MHLKQIFIALKEKNMYKFPLLTSSTTFERNSFHSVAKPFNHHTRAQNLFNFLCLQQIV